MRILLVSNAYPPNFIGGAELIAHQQARVLRAQGHEVEVFAGEKLNSGRRHALRLDELDGIPVYRICLHHKDYLPQFVCFTHPLIERHFETVLKRFRPHVCHAHNLIGLSTALPRLTRRAGVKTVVTLHDHWGFCFKNTLLWTRDEICTDFTRCARCLPAIDDGKNRNLPIRLRNDFIALMLAEADALVSPSSYLAGMYAEAGFSPERIHVIPNGVDVGRFAPLAAREAHSGRLRLSFVGALLPHKGLETLTEALGLLDDAHPVHLNVVGEGSQGPVYRVMLEKNKRRSWVDFWGRIGHEQIEEVYGETDVLVLPSLWPENQSLSITEAMASGLPVIASSLGGNLELVEEGVTGKLFQAGDARELARCIAFFERDREAMMRLGRQGFDRVRPRTLNAQVRELLDLYESLRDGKEASVNRPERLVVCSGDKVSSECARALRAFPKDEGWRFVLRDWIDEDMTNSAWMHWVVDDSLDPARVLEAHPRGAPLLVPWKRCAPRDDEYEPGEVLYYSSADEALDALRRLESNEDLRRALGYTATSPNRPQAD